jgi:uncharacterized protein
MAGKFDLKKSKNNQFYFNLEAGNGQIILTSEMYKSKPSALVGIESVKKNAPLDERYARKAFSKGQLYFVLKAGNGEPIGKSEIYSSDAAMENGIESVKTNAPEAQCIDMTTSDSASQALEITIEVPEDASPEKIRDLVRQAALRADAVHRSYGGNGLQIDLVDIFHKTRVLEGSNK